MNGAKEKKAQTTTATRKIDKIVVSGISVFHFFSLFGESLVEKMPQRRSERYCRGRFQYIQKEMSLTMSPNELFILWNQKILFSIRRWTDDGTYIWSMRFVRCDVQRNRQTTTTKMGKNRYDKGNSILHAVRHGLTSFFSYPCEELSDSADSIICSKRKNEVFVATWIELDESYACDGSRIQYNI